MLSDEQEDVTSKSPATYWEGVDGSRPLNLIAGEQCVNRHNDIGYLCKCIIMQMYFYASTYLCIGPTGVAYSRPLNLAALCQ